MNPVLLDTHIFVWSLAEPGRVPEWAWPILRDPGRKLHLSVASAWELAIKSCLGRMALPGGASDFVANGCRRSRLDLLPIGLAQIAEVERMPLHHRDPFDRMILAQARVEGMELLTTDAAFAPYEYLRPS